MSLTKRDTNILKGIAIIAMLLHHIYVCPPDGYGPFGPVLTFLGGLGKCCVAIFLFCSGYGLSAQFSKIDKVGFKTSVKFVTRRLLKFYSNYWFIFLIFVPLGVFVFDIPLSARYGEGNLISDLLLDILGLKGHNSYNITWWYNRLIILLYISFPFLYHVIKKVNWAILPISMICSRLSYTYLDPINFYSLVFWQFPFVLGILWKNNESIFKRLHILHNNKLLSIFISSSLILFAVSLRVFPLLPFYTGIDMDHLVAVCLALFTVLVLSKTKIASILSFLGKHSSNIYMTHTFIGGYWFSELLYHKLNLWGGQVYLSLN